MLDSVYLGYMVDLDDLVLLPCLGDELYLVVFYLFIFILLNKQLCWRLMKNKIPNILAKNSWRSQNPENTGKLFLRIFSQNTTK